MSKQAKPDPFIVLSLPRSRTYWAARWLSYPGKNVGHDLAIQCDNVKQFIDSYSNGMDGSVETGAMIGWRLLKHELPNLKTLVVFREPREVLASLAKFGVEGDWIEYEIKSRYYVLEGIASCAGVKRMHWMDYSSITHAEQAWEFLLDVPFDFDWWSSMVRTRLEINMKERMQATIARRDKIAALKIDMLARQQAIGFSGCPVFN